MESPDKIKDDLFDADFGKSLNFLLHKRPLSNSNPLKKGSLRKHPYSHIGYWEEHKGGMSSATIEGEPSYLEAIPILSPSMPILDVSSEHISKPILDPDDPSYAFFLKLMMILEIHQDTLSMGFMKATRMTKKSNDNG